jgi:hypothetical protein
MKTTNDNHALPAADARDLARLAPVVRAACDSAPAPETLTAIHAYAACEPRRRRILFFTRLGYAAAALFAVVLTGWAVLRQHPGADTRADRQARLLSDALFLCGNDENAPARDQVALAQRLLEIQGLDAVATPAPAAETAEPPSPPPTDSQSRSRPAPPAQRYV